MLLEFEMPVNGDSRTSSTSSTNSWNLSFSFSRTFSTAGGGFGSFVIDSGLTSGASPVMAFVWFLDAVLVWLTAKKRKLSVTKAQARMAAQRTIEPITSVLPYGCFQVAPPADCPVTG